MVRAGVVGGALGLGAFLVWGQLGCKKNECITVDCDYTHVTVQIVDNDGEPGDATSVTYTFHPYDKNNNLMDDDELKVADVDPDEVRDANCANRDEDTDECPTWVMANSFGEYTVTAQLKDEDGNIVDTETTVVELLYPASSENKACCGLVATDEVELVLDKDGDPDTAAVK